ncbi:hypothetical protein NUW58_g3589 [Xylaria curta]|uniref:Uncharacterized protein n=1 Tax=Xylaria curta TaxID=42375 RepID=A0ACC1PAU3_9PEZI|nr:hypothetical protein NUW58_g3589 [Xylaria curta]
MSLDQLYLLPPDQQEAILNGPALTPPTGVVPNLENPPNSNVVGIVITAFLLFLSTSALALAIYAKLRFVRKMYLEDYLAFAGFGVHVAQVYCISGVAAHVGLFVHQWDIRVKDLTGVLYLLHIDSEFYGVCIILYKTAIILEWIRIFVPRATRGRFFWLCQALLWVNLLFYTSMFVVGNTSCKPYAKLWDHTLPGTCANYNAFVFVSTAAYNFVSDLLILLLPQRIIWRLQLPTTKKVGLAVVFAIGIRSVVMLPLPFYPALYTELLQPIKNVGNLINPSTSACTAAAYRLFASIQYAANPDTVYVVASIMLGTQAEIVCAILIFCVPMFPKAFKNSNKPFRLLTSVFSRFKSLTNSSVTITPREWQGQRYEQIHLKGSHQSAKNPNGGVSNSSGPSEPTLTHPRTDGAYIPQMSILRTTRVSIDVESGSESTPRWLQDAEQNSLVDSSAK